MPCTVFAAGFFSVHTWTGVMYYGLQVPFLVTLLYKRTTWRAVLATLAALGAVLSFASFLASILGRPGPNTMDPLLGLALVPLCLLIAGHVGFRRKVPAAPWSFIVLMLVGVALLIRAIVAMAPAVGLAAEDGPRALAAGPAALLLCSVALWATHGSQWRWAPHVGAGIAAAVIAVSLLNVVAYMTGVASVEVSLGLLRMRLDAALVLLVVGASLLGIVMPGLAGGPIEGRIFAGFAAIMVIAVSYKLLSDAVLGAALESAATDLRAGRELASAGSSALGALLFLMAVIAIGTGTIIARTITSPLRVLRRVIRAFAAGELQSRVPPLMTIRWARSAARSMSWPISSSDRATHSRRSTSSWRTGSTSGPPSCLPRRSRRRGRTSLDDRPSDGFAQSTGVRARHQGRACGRQPLWAALRDPQR